MALAPGTKLGPYEIVSFIGAGGMGEVYRARDTRLDRDVAIKVLAERLACDPRSLARFHTEAKSIAALSHPNILSIYDAELERAPLFLVTELLQGENLGQLIKRSPLPWRRAVVVAIALADGLAAAHSAGIVHRDLKPENIFLTNQGAAKILDFGLARFRTGFEQKLDFATVTFSETDLLIGTLPYLSPEQVRGETITAASDIFSFGCVLHEMLTGRRAFQRSTPAATIAAILNDQPPPVSKDVEDVPRELDRWIAHCLKKESEARPQSARDLCLILGELLGEGADTGRFGSRGRFEAESLAVLPFLTSTSSPDAEYLADGITETLINNLAQLSQLRVVARSTVFHHRGKEVDPIKVGRDLGVNSILTGRIFQRGNVLVIAAELVSVHDGLQLWGQQYKRQIMDVFAVEEEIATEITARLRVRFTPHEQSRLTKRYTQNAEAYQLYLKGRYCWNKRTLEGMTQALSYFEQAVETDPSYARAHTGLADCMSMLAIYGGLDTRQGYTKARAAQEQALQIDPSLGEAHASRGFTLLCFDWKFLEAEGALRRALELNSGYASAHQWLGMTLGLTRRYEQAFACMKIAQQLDPFSASINTSAVWPLYWSSLWNDAIEGFRAAVNLHPGYWVAHYYLGLSYAFKGDYGQAILSLRHAAEIGDSVWRYMGLGFVYARAGERKQAQDVLTTLHEIGQRQYVPPVICAGVYAGLAENDQALDCLSRAARERNWQIAWLHIDPIWETLQSDPRLQKLQAEVRLPA
jgi:serine/threonine protein kinase/tetratricopeptide (TPR) repeat protein